VVVVCRLDYAPLKPYPRCKAGDFTMEQTVTFSVDAELNQAFNLAAEKNDCNYADLLKGFMADYVRQEASHQDAAQNLEYEAWFRRKVEAGLADSKAGRMISHEEANVRMETFKADLKRKRHAEQASL
jgi:predicted transcriptional regulator